MTARLHEATDRAVRQPATGGASGIRPGQLGRPAWTTFVQLQVVHHHTPKHASWLNQVELFFSILARRLLRRGEFTSRQDLIDKIREFTLAYDEKSVSI